MVMLLSYIYFPPDWLPQLAAIEAHAPTLQDITHKEGREAQCESIRLLNANPTKEVLKDYLSCEFDTYGIAGKLPEAINTITNESGWNIEIDNGISKGLTQYKLSTWLAECSNKDDREDPYISINCFAKMWNQGRWYEWQSWCNIYGIELKQCQWAFQ